jgi:sugar phosphate isomerase/epimerase
MKNINRREFISKAAAGIGGAMAFTHLPADLVSGARSAGIPVGFQTYPIIRELGKDIPGTFKMLADQGYETCEMCSPKGYSVTGFGVFLKMSTADLRKIITDAGLNCNSSHFLFSELGDSKLGESIEFAHQLGLSQMICSTFFLPKSATIRDYQDAAGKLNKAAAKIKEAGLQAGFHNHGFEFASIDGKLIYDALMESFDPGLVKMQFQTEVINLGYKASDYFRKYPGRFISSHLSDWTADKKEVPLGQGVMDWKEFFKALRTGGAQNIFVEMSMPTLKESMLYLKKFRKKGIG